MLEPLLDAALDLDPVERPEFVDSVCGDNLRLRAELLSLLAACEHADEILSESAAVTYEPLLSEESALPRLLGDRYHLVREIARGGMATVYLADDPKHGRQVAVKVLHAQVARLIGSERFMREIEIAANLSHPHILPLHDSGEVAAEDADGVAFLYYVSPFVTGESLRDRLNREPRLAMADVLRLGREIAQALDYAHRQGVVHLDVKPENILLQDGHAVIADFGIAHAISDAADDTVRAAAPFLGTPSYMSPEHALGVPDVDGRSDVYSLGCVLYELVTGSRPFGRATSIEAVERAKAPALPDRSLLVERSSRAVARVIMRAMAPDKSRRFRTAGELATALNGSAIGGRARMWRRPALVATSVLAVAIPLLVYWLGDAPRLDPDLIAVAPFDVTTPSLALWKEGLVDVMSRNLDGAGALRAVPATVAVRRWKGRVDAQSARYFGERTGARLVLFGGLLDAGDSVRATVVLLDAHTGHALAEIERRDVQDRMDRLSDSLTVAVLRELGRSRRIDIAHATSSPTASLAALKTYLQGEQFYRAALWDSAQVHFERALVLDSAFALAYHRLAAVRRWRDPKDIPDSLTFELMRRGSRYPRGLAPRERLLATVDSLVAEVNFAWRRAIYDSKSYVDERRLIEQLLATITDGLARYPNDPEFAFLLAETRWRHGQEIALGERDDRAFLALYDRAIALDSSFAPAYFTPISLSAFLDGPASALRYIRAYLSLAPAGSTSQVLHLDEALLDPSRAASLDFEHLADSLPPEAVCEATMLLRHVADSAEVLPRLARALEAGPPGTSASSRIPQCAVDRLVNGLQFRGHLRDAYRIATADAHWLRPFVTIHLAHFGMIPAEAARVESRHVLALAPRSMLMRFYEWWAQDGDTAAIRTYISAYETTLREPWHDTSTTVSARAGLEAGRAYLALAKRDTTSALQILLTTRDTLHDCWSQNRALLVKLLIAAGRDREAAARLARRWPGTSQCSDGVDDVEWTLARARVYERLGRREQAIANYQFVADAWRTADPELQPFVREARTAISRLRGVWRPSIVSSIGTPLEP